jgi:hypothetical protein
MITAASHSVPVYPGISVGGTIRAIFGDSVAQSLCDRRTLQDLRKRQAEIEEKLRASVGTDRQCRDWNKEKKRLLEAIRDKEISDGFVNGSLVPYLEQRQGQEICRFVPSSDNRCQIRKAKAYCGRVVREHRRRLNESNFDGTRGEIRAKSEDKKTVNLLSGRSYCSLQKGSTRSVEILAPFTRLKRA